MSLLTHDTLLDLNKLLGGFYPQNYSPYRRLHTPRLTTPDTQNTSSVVIPNTDIIKQENGYQLITELPGVSKEQLSVTLEESVLTIETNPLEEDKQTQPKDTTSRYLRRERHDGKFHRSFNLGQDIELSDIKASFKDGLLVLNIPLQKEEPALSRTIDIH